MIETWNWLWYVGVTLLLLRCVNSQGSILPDRYIIEYPQVDDMSAHHAHVMSMLDPLRDHITVHHVYNPDNNVFHGMSVELPDAHQSTFSKLLDLPLTRRLFSRRDRPLIMNSHPWVHRIYPMHHVSPPAWKAVDQNALLPLSDQPLAQKILHGIAGDGGFSKDPEHLRPFEAPISQVKQVHEQLGFTGKDVLVCLLDCGVDYNHPALGGGFGPGFKVTVGANLVDPKDDVKQMGKHLGPEDPFDPCPNNGHGTHVAGIIIGTDPAMNFTGVAPDAKLGMWRIFGCDGGANEDTVIKGLLLAHEAGCNVINLSLGVQSAWSEDAMAVVAERLSQKGVIIVAVAGNQGDDGAFLQNTPGTAKHVVSVASLDNSYYPAKVFTLDAVRGDSFVYQLSTTTETFVNGTLVTVYDMDNTQAIHGCADDLPILQNHGQEIQGNVLLVRRGGCTFDEKAQTAEQVGAIAILVYDNEPTKGTDDEPFSIMAAKSNIPVAAIAPAVARQFLTNHLLPSNVVFPEATFDKSIKTALKVSAFSSVGPTYELDLKPNVAGIGGQVFSTLPRHLEGNGGFPTGWGVRSGTSMASPHVTAIIALVLQSFHQTPTHMEQSISTYVTEHLQNHAILPNQNLGNINHPLLQGAGLVQPLDTILNPLHVSPSSISFNDTSSSKYHRHTLRVTNYGQKPLNLVLKHLPADSLDTFGLEGQLAAHRGKPKVDTGLTLPLPLPLPIFGNRIHLRKRGPFASPADPSNAIEKLQAVNPFTPQEPTPPGHTKVQLELSRRQLSLGPGQSQTFDVEVRFPPTSEHVYQMYGGYIQLHLQESRQNDTLVQANIPYFGVLGRMHELPVFDDGFPFLSTSDNISNVIPSNRVFRFHPSSLLPHGGLHPGLSSGHHRELITRQLDEQGQDTSAQSSVVPGLPAFVCRLITASPKIHFQVLHESNHQVVGYLPDTPFEYWERNRLRADDFYRMIIWDGQIQAEPGSSAAKQTVAPGNYVVRISALHLLGDPNNPNDWDNWVSGPILVE